MNFKKPSSKTIHAVLIFAIFIVLMSLSRPWYEFILAYIAYFVIFFLIFLPDSIGNMGYFIQILFHKQELANKYYEKAVKMGTKSNYALTAYGLELLRGNQPEKALPLFQRNLEIKSTKPIFIKYTEMNLATCYWKLDDIDRSIEILEDMHQKYEVFNEDFYTTLGFMYFLNDDLDTSLEYTKKALKKNREHGPAYDNMGQIHYQMGDLDKAIKYFKKGLKYKSTMADSKYYLGLIYEEQGDDEQAGEYFEMAHESNINGLNTVTREEVDMKYNAYK